MRRSTKLPLLCVGLLAFLFARACRHTWRSRLTRRQLLILSICFTALYGFSDEWHQLYVATRQADLMDGIADFAGSVLGAGVFLRMCPPKASGGPFGTKG